jgi:hypothetical protein
MKKVRGDFGTKNDREKRKRNNRKRRKRIHQVVGRRRKV